MTRSLLLAKADSVLCAAVSTSGLFERNGEIMLRSTLSKAVKSALLGSVFIVASGVSLADAFGNETVSVKVSSAGLDLHSAAGAHSMLVRMEVAAEQACGVEAEFDALRAAQFQQCYNRSLGRAVRALSQTLVTHLYVEQYPRQATQFGVGSNDEYAAIK